MNEVYFVTSNENKLREFREILGEDIKRIDIDLDEVQSMDLEYVAKHKAEEAFKQVRKPVLIEDVSFEIDAWNGFPGPLIKWLLQTAGLEGILKMIGHEGRQVTAREIIDYFDGLVHHVFEASVSGTLAFEVRGESGFGFDKIFIPQGMSNTYAELPPEKKNEISHRRKALEKLKESQIYK